MNEQDCLAYDPFFGDETDIRELADKFVTTRKKHTCNICWEPIPAGSRVRARTEVNREDRQVMTFYFCPSCCAAMAIASDDNGEAIAARTAIAMQKAGTLPA